MTTMTMTTTTTMTKRAARDGMMISGERPEDEDNEEAGDKYEYYVRGDCTANLSANPLFDTRE
jgi:hypothetical protein